MSHCIIMTAYTDLEMINTFISRIPDEWGIFIHLDKRSSISKEDIDRRARVFQWYSIYWGASEHLFAIYRLIKEAYNVRKWDYYHIVTGSDYFATAPSAFDERLGRDGLNYISCTKIPHYGWAWGCGEDIFRYKALNSWVDTRKAKWFYLGKALLKLQKRLKLGRKLPEYDIYHGLVYCSLYKDFVEWMLSSELTADLLKRLRHTVVAEEVFFQTLIMNSPFKSKVVNNPLRYDDWSKKGGSPSYLTDKHLQAIEESEALFCRKLSNEKSSGLIQVLDSEFFQ